MVELKVTGMTCGHCENAVNKALAALPGVTRVVTVSREEERVVVEGDEVTLAAVVFGFFSYRRLPVELMPDIGYPTITVRTAYEGAAPQEVENVELYDYVVVNERFDPFSAKKVVSRIGTGATAGGVIGGLIAERVGEWSDAQTMLAMLAILNAAAALGVPLPPGLDGRCYAERASLGAFPGP